MKKVLSIIAILFMSILTLFAQSAKSDSLFAIGVNLYKSGKYQEAIPFFSKSDSIDKVVLDSTSNRRNYSAMWLASCYYKNGEVSLAKEIDSLYYHLKPIDRRLTVKSDSLSSLFMICFQNRDYQAALKYVKECAEIESSIIGKNHLYYGNTLFNCSVCLAELGEMDDAIEMGTEALQIYEKVLGREDNNYVTSLGSLASFNSTIGNYIEAIRLETEALHIREDVLGKEHPDYTMSLHNLAGYNSDMGNYAEAIRLGTEALQIREKVLGKDHSDYATSLSDLALYNSYMGKYAEAIRLGTEALQICETVLSKVHPDYTMSLSLLAFYNNSMGNYAEAIRLGTEELQICERALGKDDPSYATSLGNLARYNKYMGNFAEAIRLGTEAMQTLERVLGKEHPYYATSLDNLAGFNNDIGNYAEAIRLETEALQIREKALGKEHPDYAMSLNNLAVYNSNMENYAEAIRLGTEALQICETVLGKVHPDYAMSLGNLAGYNKDIGNYAEAIRLGIEALQIREIVLGKEHPDYAMSLNDLAVYNSDMGNYTEAIRLGTEALQIYETLLGKEHPYYAMCLKNLALDYYVTKDYFNYSVLAIKAMQLGIEQIINNLYSLTLFERNTFWSRYKWWYEDWMPNLPYFNPTDSTIINAYNSIIFSKGLILNSEIDLKKILKESGDKEVLAQYDELQVKKKYLDNQYMKPIIERTLNTDSLARQIELLERKLVEKSKEFGDYTHNLRIKWYDIQLNLGEKDIGVEFVSFPLSKDSVMYAAYIVGKDLNVPKFIPLFEEKQLKQLKNIYDSSVASELIWKPLSTYLTEKKNVFFSPSGELYNIAIESLPLWDGKGRMSDYWNMYRLSSTRQLAVVKDKRDLKTAAVYGGLKYDTDTTVIINNSKKYKLQKRDVDFATLSIADTLNLRAGVQELPATKVEAEDIDKTLRNVRINDILFLDTLGTEASFKNLSGQKKNLLHIATHGFYWSEKEVKYMDGLSFLRTKDNHPRYVEDKAMTRSGLLMVGANNALKKKPLPEGIDDGILTAKEISQLDLRGLDLVVLSACQTGLGEITGDGVFGLQRGFKKAGANTLMMSLWKVDDNATQMLMTRFYENLFLRKNPKTGKTFTKSEAMKESQSYIREYEKEVVLDESSPSGTEMIKEIQQNRVQTIGEKVKIKPYQDPKYWAAFILLDAID